MSGAEDEDEEGGELEVFLTASDRIDKNGLLVCRTQVSYST
jgi:hypothetical protein